MVKHEAFFRLNVLPGEYGQADWGYFGKMPVEGGERRLYAFVMTLSWSRAIHVEFFTDDKMESFFCGFVHAVEAFGGAPRVLLVDNLKSVVLERVGDWAQYLAAPEDEALIEGLRRHERTGRVLGDEGFVDALESALARRLKPGKRGRKPRGDRN